MGSKRAMLAGSLGERLLAEVATAERFFDLFTGSAAVSHHVAERTNAEVISVDLQTFSKVLAEAVTARVAGLDASKIWSDWKHNADEWRDQTLPDTELTWATPTDPDNYESAVMDARSRCSAAGDFPLTQCYGGYYFSPTQATALDALRATLPTDEPTKTLSLAALIVAASRCAGSPGHTAQPFKPSLTAAPWLFDAWRRDVFEHSRQALEDLSGRFARKPGRAIVQDASTAVPEICKGDVVFVDPPYSSVQYSRFYHVLETIAQGEYATVDGAGRYPPIARRPRSAYSLVTASRDALEGLLNALSQRGARVILTYPKEKTSNGLSGEIVESLACDYFDVDTLETNGRFSTLGGNVKIRSARVAAYELILTLRPRG